MQIKSFIAIAAAQLFVTVSFCQGNNYRSFLFNDPSVAWAGEYESLVNLSPKTNTINIKKWWIGKIRTSGLYSYQVNADGKITDSTKVYKPDLSTPEWLNNYFIRSNDRPVMWEVMAKKQQEYGFRILPSFGGDSCCGCDDANAFRVKQLLIYKNASFSVKNILWSPLCVRRKNDHEGEWYAMPGFGFNTNTVRSSQAQYITTSEVTYHIDPHDTINDFSVVTEGDPELIKQIMTDIDAGKFRVFDAASNKRIQAKDILTWRMPYDTIPVFNTEGETTGYQVVQQQLNIRDLNYIRLSCKWYFDFTTNKLFAEINSITLMQQSRTPWGTFRAVYPLFRLEPAQTNTTASKKR